MRGSTREAEPLQRRSLAIREEGGGGVGPKDPALTRDLESYASLLRKMRRDREAIEIEARLGATHLGH